MKVVSKQRSRVGRTVIHTDPEILGGTPVFRGTRVPFKTFIGYLGHGRSLSDFLKGFPTVTKKQALAALDEAKEALLEKTRAA